MTITIEQLVQREVVQCVSFLVSTLAAPWDVDHVNEGMDGLHEQAQELCYPLQDYEEAATQAGWEAYSDRFGAQCWRKVDAGEQLTWAGTSQDLCENHDIEPYEWEVYEHWAVSNWLATMLLAQGEKVDTDFAGMCVWARTTSGQGISSDSVIARIYADMVAS